MQKQKEQFEQEPARPEKYRAGLRPYAALAYAAGPYSCGYREIKEQPCKIAGLKNSAMLQKDQLVHVKAITEGTDIIGYRSFSVLKFLQWSTPGEK
ncbi:hypothetical protein [Akkermansia muciniphila]|uniref:hypothetical protein n=1 Tax=Akkermansia muciniphila TaxID=239935 RepID=UPI001BFEEDA4|nr:hypothetical protein [Akkermansia muciniphila]MBT8778137.1 hypothetical protein [Akkermansia muciniphila]